MSAFTVTPLACPDYALLTVIGELDLATKDRLGEHGINLLLEPAVPTLVIDLSSVSFIDAVGLGVLVNLRNVARQVGKQLLLVHVPPCVQRLLDITGLDAHFEQQIGDTEHGIDTFLVAQHPTSTPRGTIDDPQAYLPTLRRRNSALNSTMSGRSRT